MTRNPGVIADCTGDNAGDSVGPSADGFETYGVTGVALITFIMLAVPDAKRQVQLLVWIFSMRVMMVISSGVGYFINGAIRRKAGTATPIFDLQANADHTGLADFDSFHRAHLHHQFDDDSQSGRRQFDVVETCHHHQLRHLGRSGDSRICQSIHLHHLGTREIAPSAGRRAGIAGSSGFVAGNFSAYWLGMAMMALMSMGYFMSTMFPPAPNALMLAPAVFAFGLVAFGFLGMGPVTIAVDSYGPVTDNVQTVYGSRRIAAGD